MQRAFLRTGLFAACSLLLAACGPKDPMADASKALSETVLLPAYTDWHDADLKLAASAKAYCAGQASLDEARAAYRQAGLSWARLQPMLIGPLGEGNLAWQVQFWPDKKNLVARQVNALLKSHPQLTHADVESASVVLQGLTAYEYLLFDPELNPADPATRDAHCPLLIAIGEHQERLAADILGQWQGETGLAAQLSKLPSTRYADSREAIGDILRIQVTALDGLKKKLGMPLGLPGQGIAQPYQAEAWRSGASLAHINATVEAAKKLWEGSQNNGLRSLLGKDQSELAKRIDTAYADVLGRLAALGKPLADGLADEAGRAELNGLYDAIGTLHRLHQSDLAKALNVQIGFNAHDGD